jgi:outer membrane receptor for Fe3+-dicitrate
VTRTGIGAVTDRNGDFVLRLSGEAQDITITFLGYLSKTITVSSAQADLGTIMLEVSPTSLNEIIVSATPQNFRSDFKGPNFRLSPKAIKNMNPLNTEELLRTVPGVNIVGDVGLSNRPNISIRGSWGRRSRKILLMEDGSPAAPALYMYIRNNQGEEVPFDEATLTEADFAAISKTVVHYGKGNVEGARAPYVPNLNLSGGFSYNYKQFSAGISGSYVGDQHAEFMNFKSESADGAIGKLGSFYTIDCNFNRDFVIGDNMALNAFINGKNITNEIYRASRLNRAASGVFPGGFRQFVIGVNLRI